MLRGWTASANVLPGGSLRRINGLYRSVSADFQGIVARPRIFPRLVPVPSGQHTSSAVPPAPTFEMEDLKRLIDICATCVT